LENIVSPTIESSDRGPVRILTISNPAKRNAFSGGMAPTLRKLLAEAEADPSVRCVVITGDGNDAFSSGHDLNEVLEHPETAGDPEANAAFTLPASMGTPVIGAVNGHAYAAGFILALNCDLRIAGDNVQFCAVGARIGLVPVGGQLSRLLSIVTYPTAFKFVATATPFGAEEALRVGFVTATCPPEETLDRALAVGAEISSASPAVVRAAKTGLAATLNAGMVRGQDLEAELAAVVRRLPDGDEGVRSFLDKRPPLYPNAPPELQSQLDDVAAQ